MSKSLTKKLEHALTKALSNNEELRAEVAQLRHQNIVFRAAQKACEDCDAPTMAEVTALREEKARLIAPCCSKKWAPKRGEEWELVAIEAGHVFAWRSDRRCPRYQYACCVGCGKALHELKDSNRKKEKA